MNKPLFAAWLAAIAATLGSLYFSEVKQFVPCNLCWYQRILMYPLAIWLGIAAYRNDRSITTYVLPVSVIGMLLSGYHYALQKVPAMKGFEICTSGIPCSGQYINYAGFITIPFLALVGFTVITVCMILARRHD
ncbi:disulfide oxidoreductase [Fictibacillus aquaticus]|uniref:Disulfide bond formation protein B n=1 Tax=Fictibacillus aquaticus TaxID=2021314 RepID=A0A235F8A1_9BACL|nr:disulfide oxidoreductase [Fictibacillus aquaticus]OYD57429.1 disulfide bond formation protein B [Fictibacillus aquaticus]